MSHIRSSITGTILEVLVAPGDRIALDDDVVLVESMKMEIPVAAEVAGVVTDVRIARGDVVREGDILMVLA